MGRLWPAARLGGSRAGRRPRVLARGDAGEEYLGADGGVKFYCRTRNVLKQNGASLTFLPSEDVSVWPEYLRTKMERGEV